MKKILKIALAIVVVILFISTFVFLYQKSQPKTIVYATERAKIGTLADDRGDGQD